MATKIEVILSSSGKLTITKAEKSVTFTSEQLWRLVEKHRFPSGPKKLKVGAIDKYDLDIPKKSGKIRRGEAYFDLYIRIKALGFTDKKLEHNILDSQRKGIISRKWRKDGQVHLPSFLMEATEGEILKVLNYLK